MQDDQEKIVFEIPIALSKREFQMLINQMADRILEEGTIAEGPWGHRLTLHLIEKIKTHLSVSN